MRKKIYLTAFLLLSQITFANTCKEYFELIQYPHNTGFWEQNIDSIAEKFYKIDTNSLDTISLNQISYTNSENTITQHKNGLNLDVFSYLNDTENNILIGVNRELAGIKHPDTLFLFKTDGSLDSTHSRHIQSREDQNSRQIILRQNDSIGSLLIYGSSEELVEVFITKGDTTYGLNGSDTTTYFANGNLCQTNGGTISKMPWGWLGKFIGKSYISEYVFMNRQQFITPLHQPSFLSTKQYFIFPNGVIKKCNTEECKKLAEKNLGIIYGPTK